MKFLDGVPRQLRFRHDDEPRRDGDALSGTGQLIADPRRTDHRDTVPLSRPDIGFADVERALDGWQHWTMLTTVPLNLAEIRRPIRAAGLD